MVEADITDVRDHLEMVDILLREDISFKFHKGGQDNGEKKKDRGCRRFRRRSQGSGKGQENR
jgi:hypothetical protein